MISLLLPSRRRPKIFSRMVSSVRGTAKNPVEIVARFDDDDLESAKSAEQDGARVLIGPRIRNITAYWNECFDACHGEIVAQWNDDVVLVDKGWDILVEKAFAEVPDKILVCHGDDIWGHRGNFGPHPFTSRRWVECLGVFIYPYYTSDFGDAGLNELADRLGRRRFVPFIVEHHHYSYKKCEPDENTLERLKRHEEDDPDSTYYSSEKMQERINHAQKLAKLMDAEVDTKGWTPIREKSGVLSAGKCSKCGSLSTVFVQNEMIFCNGCAWSWNRK